MTHTGPVYESMERYNALCAKHGFAFSAIRPHHLKHVKRFEEFVEWCDLYGIDPPDYIEALFRFLAKRPNLNTLRSLVAHDEYISFRAYKQLRDGPHGLRANAQNHLVLFTRAQEAVRRNHVLGGTTLACLHQQDPVYLYDPRSQWCPSCKQASHCAQRLNASFGQDVVQLRLSHPVGTQAGT